MKILLIYVYYILYHINFNSLYFTFTKFILKSKILLLHLFCKTYIAFIYNYMVQNRKSEILKKSKKKDKLPLCLCFLSFLRIYATRGNLLFGFALIVWQSSSFEHWTATHVEAIMNAKSHRLYEKHNVELTWRVSIQFSSCKGPYALFD